MRTQIPQKQERVFSTHDAAQRLAVHINTLRRKIAAGQFPHAFRIGRDVRIPESDIHAFIERNRIAPAPSR